jgi:2-dehydropantoate 2-reductase
MSNQQTIAVIGAGAMGSIYAALLAGAGHDVWAIDVDLQHVQAIQRNGLRVEGASGDRTVRLNAATTASEAGKADLVIIATKAAHAAEAANAAKDILKPETPVVTIQNGLGAAQRVAEIVGPERVIMGVVGGFGASLKAPGHAHHNGMEFVRLGAFDGPVTPRLDAVAETWRSGGFKVLTFDDIHKMVWEKLICNCAFSGPCGVTGLTVGQVLSDPDASALSAACATEAYAVARALKIAVEIDDPVAYTRAFGAKIPHSKPSLLQDIEAGRPTEIDAINGAIPPAGAEIGIDAPTNLLIARIIRARTSAS